MKRFFIFISFLVLIVACNNNNDTNFEEVAIPVSVTEIETKLIEQFVETSGTVYSTKEATLRTEATGKYNLLKNKKTNQPYRLGDIVDSGEVVIRLEDKEYENGIMLESKKLNLDITRRMFEQQKSLKEKGGVTEKELIDAERAYIDAKYSYENAKIGIEKLEISAPFKGVIVDLPYYTKGVKLNSGSIAMKIMGYHQLYFEINLPEKEMNNIKVSQKVRVFNYSYPKDTFPAFISQLSPVINPTTRSFKGYITVNNPQLLLRPGMFVKAEIITASKDSAIIIPRNIILLQNSNHIVYTIEKNRTGNNSFGTAFEKRLTLGLENPREVEVTEGVNAGELIVIRGFETLRNRSKVKVVR